ncbi:MAG: bacteriochlorophyll 4-vinyl reductase [Pseudomonadota bacterium]
MPRAAPGAEGLIGPNAVLQLLPVIERLGGQDRVRGMLDRARIAEVPDGSQMIPEGQAARLHGLLRVEEPDRAASLAAEAGRRTADYILRHRIPAFAQRILRLLPAPLAARLFSKAIARHAWTFAGSGGFTVVTPWTFEIADNPVIRGEVSAAPLCHWHAAVFERLYRVLVHPKSRCVEVACGAQSGAGVCRFEISVPRA